MTGALQLKITLVGCQPEIWRRVIVPDSLSLHELHAVFQGVMGWEDSHLHMFEIAGKRYEAPDDDGYGLEDENLDERQFKISSILKQEAIFNYQYDFGDNWWHRIEIENLSCDIPQVFYGGLCIEGGNACPPEDVSGVDGYQAFLKDISGKNPDDSLRWRGRFDPAAFNPQQATLLIHCMCALYSERYGYLFAVPE